MANAGSTNSAYALPYVSPRLMNIAFWVLQVALAAMFVMSGVSKLTGAAEMVTLFDAVGIGQWFRYVTGGLELLGALLLLVPARAAGGAAILAMVMVGAVLTHLFIIGGSPAMPIALLGGAIVVMWGRWERFSALQEKQP